MVRVEPVQGHRVRIIGTGRAGGSFAAALTTAGWDVESVSHAMFDEAFGRSGQAEGTVDPVDLVLICVPDRDVANVAATIDADPSTAVLHCSGSLGLDVLAPAERRASVHPLVALTDAASGARSLVGAYFAVSGDPVAQAVVTALSGRSVAIAEKDRSLYHAGAVIASNHLVALMGQVQGIAAQLDMPVDAYWALARGALARVESIGARDALTGPVSRGDWETLRRHLRSLEPAERDAYVALAREAASLAGRVLPDL